MQTLVNDPHWPLYFEAILGSGISSPNSCAVASHALKASQPHGVLLIVSTIGMQPGKSGNSIK